MGIRKDGIDDALGMNGEAIVRERQASIFPVATYVLLGAVCAAMIATADPGVRSLYLGDAPTAPHLTGLHVSIPRSPDRARCDALVSDFVDAVGPGTRRERDRRRDSLTAYAIAGCGAD